MFIFFPVTWVECCLINDAIKMYYLNLYIYRIRTLAVYRELSYKLWGKFCIKCVLRIEDFDLHTEIVISNKSYIYGRMIFVSRTNLHNQCKVI